MRAEGSTLGRVREWSPSPVWPEGRGLMLLRPLLEERRETLRAWLTGQGAGWIEDPANADPRFGRSRARRALAGTAPDVERGVGAMDGEGGGAQARISATAEETAWIARDIGARALAAALVCVGGAAAPPRGDRLARLVQRLRASEDFSATLCGARLEAQGETVILMREAGEFVRLPSAPVLAPLVLAPGVEGVWDGRFAFLARAPGWSVVPARGRLSMLSAADRAMISALPVATRGAFPVLIRDGETGPLLASPQVERRGLVSERLRLALDETTHEDDLNAPP